jgi:hypothetical protein
MDQDKDWKPIAALVLAGLALAVALGGGRSGTASNDQVSTVPQQIIIQPIVPSTGTSGGTTAPAVAVPEAQTHAPHAWGGSRAGFPIFCLFPLLLLGGLAFLAFRKMGSRRHGWGGPGWYNHPWGGPGPGPQGPPNQHYQGQYQYPPQYAQGQGQPYEGYPQGGQPQQGQQAQPNQSTDAQGDITRPQGTVD